VTVETSTVTRVRHGKRETSTTILEADNLSVRVDQETGEVVLELFRYGANDRAVESYQLRLCRQDRERVRAVI
jgi:hypothetical protein